MGAHKGDVSAETWEALLGLLATMSVKEAVAKPGMPTHLQVQYKRRRDRAFDARAKQIMQARGVRRAKPKGVAYPEAVWEQFLAHLVSGLSVSEAANIPGMPSQPAWNVRRRKNKAFDERVRAVWNGKAPPSKDSRWDEALRRVAAGEAFHLIAGKAGLPTQGAWNHRRRQDPAFAERVTEAMAGSGIKSGRKAGFSIYSKTEYEAVIEELKSGRTLAHAAKVGLPPPSAVRLYRRRNRDFDARVRGVLYIPRGNVAARPINHRISLSQNEVWAAANSAVHYGIPAFIRDDVIGEMVADVLEGYLTVDEMKKSAKSYIADYYRESGFHKSRSFDAPTFGDGPTLHDRLGQ